MGTCRIATSPCMLRIAVKGRINPRYCNTDVIVRVHEIDKYQSSLGISSGNPLPGGQSSQDSSMAPPTPFFLGLSY